MVHKFFRNLFVLFSIFLVAYITLNILEVVSKKINQELVFNGQVFNQSEFGAHLLSSSSGPLFSLQREARGTGEEDVEEVIENPAFLSGTKELFPVVVIDSGIDYTHPELKDFMHINETTTELVVYKDLVVLNDRFGWDFNNQDNYAFDSEISYKAQFEKIPSRSEDNQGADFWERAGSTIFNNVVEFLKAVLQMGSPGHGTHVSGIVVDACAGKCSIVPLKTFGAKEISLDMLIASIRYARMRGYKVVNMSLASTWNEKLNTDSETGEIKESSTDRWDDLMKIREEIENSPDMIFVVAAGNSGDHFSRDKKYSFPAAFDLPNIITVGAVDEEAKLARFSNFDTTLLDVFAPGVDVTSTWTGGGTKTVSGTSMSSPFIAGLVGYIWATNPSYTSDQVKSALYSALPKREVTYVKKSRSEDKEDYVETLSRPVITSSEKDLVYDSL
jgi:subtilisin family serine protease